MANLMSNMIPGADGGSLTQEQKVTLGYLVYNPVTDRLESSKPLGTTIHSLYFGDVHSMSSSFSNVVWTNRETNINYQAVGTAMGPHSELGGDWVANQPTARHYLEYEQRDLGGAVGDGSVVLDYYTVNPPVSDNTSNWGHTWVAGEDYTGELHYTVYATDSNRLVMDRHYDVDVLVGGTITQIFETPLDYYAGSLLTFELRKNDGTLMKVYSSADQSRFWVRIHSRKFNDEPLPMLAELSDFELAMSQENNFDNFIQDTDGSYWITADGHFIEWVDTGYQGSVGDKSWIKLATAPAAVFVTTRWESLIDGTGSTSFGRGNIGVTLNPDGSMVFANVGTYLVEWRMTFNSHVGDPIDLNTSDIASNGPTLDVISNGRWISATSAVDVDHNDTAVVVVTVTTPGTTITPTFSCGVIFQQSFGSLVTVERIAK